MNSLFDDAQAHARSTDVAESHAAAASVKDLTGNQRAILAVMRTWPSPLTDEKLVEIYTRQYKAMNLPRQSESGLRSRRAELARAEKIVEAGKGTTAGGRSCRSWVIV